MHLSSPFERLYYVHPRAKSLSHVNAVANLVDERIAITKQPLRFLALFARFRRRNGYIVAGNLDLIATLAMYLMLPFPGHFMVLMSDHRTNVFHKAIVRFYVSIKGAHLAIITHEVRKQLAEKLGSRILEVGHVVYHSSATADAAIDNRLAKSWDERGIDVLLFGRLCEERGVREFLEIAKARTDLRFAVAGAGPLQDIVEEASRRSSNIEFMGYIQGVSAKLAALTNCRILFSNMQGVENFGISILEAVACGAAVSCPRDYGPAEILGEDSPYIRPVDLSTAEKIVHIGKVLASGPLTHEVSHFHSRELSLAWHKMFSDCAKLA